MKAFKSLVVLSVIIAFCSCSSKESQLVERGQRFILNQLNDPSSAKFISSTSSDKIESLLISWGVTLEEKHDAIMLEVEGSNAYGGRVRKSYCVFFVNGNPIDYADAEDLNRVSIHQYITTMKQFRGW